MASRVRTTATQRFIALGLVVALMVAGGCSVSSETLVADLTIDRESSSASLSDGGTTDEPVTDTAEDDAPSFAPTPTPVPEPTATSEPADDAEVSSGSSTVTGDDDLSEAELECLDDSGYSIADFWRAGLDTESGIEGDTENVYNTLFNCAPSLAQSPQFIDEFKAGFGDDVLGEPLLDEEASCLVQRLIDSGSGGTTLFGDDPTELGNMFEECLTAEHFATITLAPGSGPQTYGDDPTLDLLWDRCLAEDDTACDLLLAISVIDSEYEATALGCSNGLFVSGGCTAGMEDNDLDGFIESSSPGLPAMSQRCLDGEMIPCDYLYQWSEFNSDFERIGATCGDREDYDGVVLCIERIGEFAN